MRSSGMKQKELAKHVSITEQTLSRYKKGARLPDTEELYRLAIFLGVSIDWLLGRNEPVDSEQWKERALQAEAKLEKLSEVVPLISQANTILASIITK